MFDTARGALVPFGAAPGAPVRMYVCGVTPYDSAHVGHAATFLAYDVLARRLRDMGCSTRCVRNITDVDDDLLARARAMGVHYLDLAAGSLAEFDAGMEALGLLGVDSEPRATSAVPTIRRLVGRMLERGRAYVSGENVYFDSQSPSSGPTGFGDLCGLSEAEMVELARTRGGRPDDPAKRHRLDFVVWQRSAADEPEWSSLWGPGRPGWHVECTALALDLLGDTVDLHGGGSDLIFPHHECSQAAASAVTGKPLARHWMHTAMVRIDGVKMSKSAGNLEFVAELAKRFEPMALRVALLGNHYRNELDWHEGLAAAAARRLERWREAQGAGGTGDGALAQVRRHLDDDLDTPAALAAMDDAAARGEPVTDAAALLGVRL